MSLALRTTGWTPSLEPSRSSVSSKSSASLASSTTTATTTPENGTRFLATTSRRSHTFSSPPDASVNQHRAPLRPTLSFPANLFRSASVISKPRASPSRRDSSSSTPIMGTKNLRPQVLRRDSHSPSCFPSCLCFTSTHGTSTPLFTPGSLLARVEALEALQEGRVCERRSDAGFEFTPGSLLASDVYLKGGAAVGVREEVFKDSEMGSRKGWRGWRGRMKKKGGLVDGFHKEREGEVRGGKDEWVLRWLS